MFDLGAMSAGGLLLLLLGLLIWIVLLVWLSERILRFIGLRTAWGPLDPRNMIGAFLLLTGAIHLGNYGLDLIEQSMSDGANTASLTFPSAFLIGSVAIGVGIAAVRHWQRQKK
ncbi:hypothetical protein QWY75_09975 [Pontixanthobacter aestiaquae]|uniref:Uncharacterized protein n=1 Tax=Pontixanthobacter aestiaquae TaxID=1509367 RepID=A0A844Z437_9SPHN|nr:hypothetical protein [Pontixanthobacter aestiaquae]MDN3646524.1 hypothetical protein [Pontixanthobacter aestiaquae]MXO82488.1 hypothetical protein [Pontixanthobacter aestiaquae]